MNIQKLRESNRIIFEAIVGSQAYGTATPESDIDIKGVYVQSNDEILTFGYIEQISDEKNDTTYYEIRRFLELLKTNNPNIIELLNIPEEYVMYEDEVWKKYIKPNIDNFITTKCKNTFGGYAISQIKKARGLNKKIVNPVDKEKKSPIDFCYVIRDNLTVPLRDVLDTNNMDQIFCGLSKVSNARDLYSLFYDFDSHLCFSKRESEDDRAHEIKIRKESNSKIGLGFKGIVKEDDDGKFISNELRLSSIPKDCKFIMNISYNKDGYMSYCKDYKEYWKWVENRNQSRYNDNSKHGKGYDGKNLSHCIRLLDMALEIGRGEGIKVLRPNPEKLLEIKKGKYAYDSLIEEANSKINELEQTYNTCNLPLFVSEDLINKILLSIRHNFNESLYLSENKRKIFKLGNF